MLPGPCARWPGARPCLASPRQAEVVPEPDRGALDERIGLPAVMEGDLPRLAPLEEGAGLIGLGVGQPDLRDESGLQPQAGVVERATPFGAKCQDLPAPASCSLLAGNPSR